MERSGFLGLAFGALGAFFDAHIFEFAGLEDFAAFEAFQEFRIFFAAHDLHARMFARLLACVLRLRERLRGHKSGGVALLKFPGKAIRGNSRYFSPALPLVKCLDALFAGNLPLASVTAGFEDKLISAISD